MRATETTSDQDRVIEAICLFHGGGKTRVEPSYAFSETFSVWANGSDYLVRSDGTFSGPRTLERTKADEPGTFVDGRYCWETPDAFLAEVYG